MASPKESIVLNIPGWKNSGEGHWQTIWETNDARLFQRIEQENWMFPEKEDWIFRIKKAFDQHQDKTIFVTAHSIGSMAFIHAVQNFPLQVKGALLVAPSDPEQRSYPREITGFDPVPLFRLPFPSILVASSDDEAVSADRAKWFARHWGSEFILLDRAGHIDQKTGYGTWDEGKKLLEGDSSEIFKIWPPSEGSDLYSQD